MIIDFHTHCFPVSVAQRAMNKLGAVSMYKPCLNGTLCDLKQSMAQAGVNYSVVLNIATNARQTENVNDFAISSAAEDGIIPFGSVHPMYANYNAEFARLRAAGIKGIKFHPDFQDFKADDRAMYPVYEKALQYGFVLLFHCGHDLDSRARYNCTPRQFARVASDFKGAPVVGAHLGGQDMWDDVFKYVCGKPFYVDTSYGFGWLAPEQLKRFLGEHDNSKILFGTDSPWQSQSSDVQFMRNTVGGELYNKIMGGNAAALLGINS